MIGWDFKDHLK